MPSTSRADRADLFETAAALAALMVDPATVRQTVRRAIVVGAPALDLLLYDWREPMSLETSPLLTDLYQLTMLYGYFRHGTDAPAIFELFVRKLPTRHNFLVAAGLEQVVEYLETLRFGAEDLDWVRQSGRFDPAFLDYLAALRFTGDGHAMPEGTVFFPDEPIVRVTAPFPRRSWSRRAS